MFSLRLVCVWLAGVVRRRGAGGRCGLLLAGLGALASPVAAQPVITSFSGDAQALTDYARTLEVTATGTPPLSYQWYEGISPETFAPLSGANASTYATGTLHRTAAFWVRVTDGNGAFTNSATSTISILPTVEGALDVDGVATFSGQAEWFRQETVTADGYDAAQSGAIGHSQSSSLHLSVAGPGEVTFYWRVSSEAGYDFLSLSLNGTPVEASPGVPLRISGESGWQQQALTLPPGRHTLTWTYAKDGSLVAGADAGWLDRVVVPVVLAPTITLTASSTAVAYGGSTLLSTTRSGTEPISLQWYAGDSGDTSLPIPGATGAGYTPPDLFAPARYWVRASNGAGSRDSATTVLTPTPPPGRHLFAFGWRSRGKLGLGDVPNFVFPPRPVGPSDVLSAVTGDSHSLYVRADGSLWGAGDGYYGQLGQGNASSSSTPVLIPPVAPASPVVAIAAAEYHSLQLRSDGSLLVTGRGQSGQLGLGTSALSTVVFTPLATRVVGVAASQDRSYYLRADGTLWASGRDLVAGDYGLEIAYSPLLVATGVRRIVAGPAHALFLDSAGSLWGLGNNWDHQLGPNAGLYLTPVLVATGVAEVATGRRHTLFRRTDGTLWGLGDNSYGQLGLTSPTTATVPLALPLPAGAPVTALAASDEATFLRRADGSLWFTGTFPDLSAEFAPRVLATGLDDPAIAAGYTHAFLLTASPTLDPTILSGPADARILPGGTATLTVAVRGFLPTYQWYRGETGITTTPLVGATGPSFTTPALTADTRYWVRVTLRVTADDEGDATFDSPSALVDVVPTTLPEALDLPASPAPIVGTSGAAPWFAQLATSADGLDAAQSGAINHDQSTTLQVGVSGPLVVRFQWRVSSESFFDPLIFLVDGVERARLSGETGWLSHTEILPAGAHTLSWTYQKDGSVVVGADAGWVDQIEAFPSPAITLTAQPQSVTIDDGGTAVVSVGASSPLPLTYQWYRGIAGDTGLPIANATTDTLTYVAPLFSAQAVWVRVTSAVGSVDSTTAFVAVGRTPLLEALDLPPGTLLQNPALGAGPRWFGQNATTSDGVDAGQSGALAGPGSSGFLLNLQGPGQLSFRWRVSARENGLDVLAFFLGASLTTPAVMISGEQPWATRQYDVPVGSQVAGFVYFKSAPGRAGEDAGWVDQVVYTPTPPAITQQPVGFTVPYGSGASLSVTANGPVALAYQWYRGVSGDTSRPISGAHAATYSTSDETAFPATRQTESYWVAVLAANGAIVFSETATITVSPPANFAAWMAGHGSYGTEALFAADYDSDGLTNGLEYALGTRPDQPTPTSARPSFALLTSGANQTLVLTHRRYKPAALLRTYRASTDLIAWAGVTPTLVEILNTDVDGTGQVELVRVTLSASTAPRRFAELRVTDMASP